MKYRIFVDTNQLFSNKGPLDQPFNTDIPHLRKFLDDHGLENVEICLPEIVVEERIQQKLEDIDQSIQQANENIERLQAVGHKSKIMEKKNYKKLLRTNARDFIKKHKVKKIPLPSTTKKDLINRALTKMRPFTDGDFGFKDTLIYLSLVENALNKTEAADHYIFCTNDTKGFNEEIRADFEEQTGKSLHIVPTFAKVQEKLDEIVPLGLQLEERNARIKNVVDKNIGSVMLFLNKTQLPTRDSSPYGPLGLTRNVYDQYGWIVNSATRASSVGIPSVMSEDSEARVVGYDFSSIDFLNFEETSSDNYAVLVDVQTVVQHNSNQTSPDVYSVLHNPIGYDTFKYGPYRSQYRTFTVQLNVNMGTQEITIGYAATPAAGYKK